jgi:CheY-like chemotaxis protein
LFSPFCQADVSSTRKYGGAGLGLSISKQLVEMMGGKIDVASTAGEGSTFWFTAMFAVPREPVPLPVVAPSPRNGRTAPMHGADRPRRKARILVAEDNPTNQMVLRAQLEKLGYEARVVANGVAAVEAVRQGDFDLVLMDCQMPEMDGYEATRAIRQSSCPRIPIVAVTANAMVGDRERCIGEGMVDYLSKPVALKPLANVLAAWLPWFTPQRSARAAVPEPPEPPERADATFDEAALMSRLLGDRKLAGDVLAGFLADSPGLLDRLRQRLDERDAPGVIALAHALKGAAAAASAGGLHSLTVAMEQAGHSGGLQDVNELLSRAVDEFERLKGALRRAGWCENELRKTR